MSNLPTRTEFRPFDMEARDDIAKLDAWSSDPTEMMHINTESIARHHLSTGAYVAGELAGYGAITVIYSRETIELGGLVVNPAMRRHRIGSSLVKHLVGLAREELQPSTILAFSNERSSRLFIELGGTVVEDLNSLPNEVWKLCYICPLAESAHAAGKACCNRVLDITGIEV